MGLEHAPEDRGGADQRHVGEHRGDEEEGERAGGVGREREGERDEHAPAEQGEDPGDGREDADDEGGDCVRSGWVCFQQACVGGEEGGGEGAFAEESAEEVGDREGGGEGGAGRGVAEDADGDEVADQPCHAADDGEPADVADGAARGVHAL